MEVGMRTTVVLLALMSVAAPLYAQSADPVARITIDAPHDTLSAADRTGALSVVERPFEVTLVDRTQVMASQASPPWVPSHSLYAWLGYGGVFGDRAYGTPAHGFGYRFQLESFAVDISVNLQANGQCFGWDILYGCAAATALKLEGLHFVKPRANATSFVGGGLGWGGSTHGDSCCDPTAKDWDGSGLQAGLTVGYEVARASRRPIFVQAQAVLPFFRATSHVKFIDPSVVTATERRYVPSMVVSVGLAWRLGGRP
jgi:hypothetical protein